MDVEVKMGEFRFVFVTGSQHLWDGYDRALVNFGRFGVDDKGEREALLDYLKKRVHIGSAMAIVRMLRKMASAVAGEAF